MSDSENESGDRPEWYAARELVETLSIRGAVFPTEALFRFDSEETAQAALGAFGETAEKESEGR
jgi:hypothetical protein